MERNALHIAAKSISPRCFREYTSLVESSPALTQERNHAGLLPIQILAFRAGSCNFTVNGLYEFEHSVDAARVLKWDLERDPSQATEEVLDSLAKGWESKRNLRNHHSAESALTHLLSANPGLAVDRDTDGKTAFERAFPKEAGALLTRTVLESRLGYARALVTYVTDTQIASMWGHYSEAAIQEIAGPLLPQQSPQQAIAALADAARSLTTTSNLMGAYRTAVLAAEMSAIKLASERTPGSPKGLLDHIDGLRARLEKLRNPGSVAVGVGGEALGPVSQILRSNGVS